MQIRVAFHTLGCKLNQLETESLADAFRRSGASILGRSENPVTAPADLFVINTCTVTGKAEQKARRLVRQALAANPAALVLVTGCYAQVDPGALSVLHERALVIPGDEKSALLSLAAWLADEWQGHGDLLDAVIAWKRGMADPSAPDAFAFMPDEFAFHSRPSLKVQDGCDNRCSYCRVCIARGGSRSLPAPEVLRRLTALEAAGRAEAILTGVNLFQYRDEGLRFPDLLRLLIEGTERIALRLSSWEPEGLDASFLDILAHPRIRPHIHLPVQSGSDLLLGRMARAYRRDQVIEACAALRAAKGDLFIAADLIAGFPGEEEADFEATLDLARACDFAWIHAFPFSPRPGTRAFGMGPHVPERISGERVRLLGELARLGRASYIGRQGGREVEAVLEASPRGGEEGFRHATSDNYLKLLIGAVPAHIPGGSAFRCRIGFAAGRKGDPRLGDADAQASFISP